MSPRLASSTPGRRPPTPAAHPPAKPSTAAPTSKPAAPAERPANEHASPAPKAPTKPTPAVAALEAVKPVVRPAAAPTSVRPASLANPFRPREKDAESTPAAATVNVEVVREPVPAAAPAPEPAKIVPFVIEGPGSMHRPPAAPATPAAPASPETPDAEQPQEASITTNFPFQLDGDGPELGPFWLGEHLLGEGRLTREQLEEAKRVHSERPDSGPFSETLELLKLASAHRLAQIIADKFNLECRPKLTIDREVVRSVLQSSARNRCYVPVKFVGDTVEIAVADPSIYNHETAAVDFPRYSKHIITVSPRKEILAAIEEAWTAPITITNADDYVDDVLKKLIDEGNSDAHFENWGTHMTIRKRKDGELLLHENVAKENVPGVLRSLMIRSRIKIEDTRFPADGLFMLKVGASTYRIRTSTMPQVHGIKVALRIGTADVMERSFASLGMWPDHIEQIHRISNQSEGAVFHTGPTGSGKSTLQGVVISHLPLASENVVSLEDPVEYDLPGVNQVQIRSDIGFNYAVALKYVLRQDPDVIVMGEIRDKETCSLAVQAALTGHLFLGTLHTNDSAGAVTRIVELGIEPYLVANALYAVIAQRLVKRLCTCKVPAKNQKQLQEQFGIKGTIYVEKPDGCGHCKNGYSGRIGIFEIMELKGWGDAIDSEIESLITSFNRKDNPTTAGDLRRYMREKRGMVTLRDDAMRKVGAGETTLKEVLTVLGPLMSDGGDHAPQVPDPQMPLRIEVQPPEAANNR